MVGAAAVCFLASGLGARADERPLAFTAIDFPGAVFTTAFGINGHGEVVGSYRDVAGRVHGFVLSGETFRSIDFAGSVATDARGISPAGDVVGSYRLAGEPTLNAHGYVLTRHGEFLPTDFPGHLNTILQRIAPDGTIVGCYHDTDTMETMHGIVIKGEDATALDMPAASMHNGVTPDLTTIVGLYTDMETGKGRAYLLRNGDFVPFDVPGSTFTAGWDINPRGDVVGVYRDAAGGFHGFVVDASRQDPPSEWAFTAVDYPGAAATRAFGINAGGDVVGHYVDATGRTHGFLASRTAGHNQ